MRILSCLGILVFTTFIFSACANKPSQSDIDPLAKESSPAKKETFRDPANAGTTLTYSQCKRENILELSGHYVSHKKSFPRMTLSISGENISVDFNSRRYSGMLSPLGQYTNASGFYMEYEVRLTDPSQKEFLSFWIYKSDANRIALNMFGVTPVGKRNINSIRTGEISKNYLVRLYPNGGGDGLREVHDIVTCSR